MSAASAQGPATAVFFGTSELVILMLTNLPTISLIRAMRVSRDFHAKIRDGPEVKKTLFLGPASPIAHYRAPTWAHPEKYNSRQGYSAKVGHIITASSSFDADNDEYLIGTPNPLFSLEDHCVQQLDHPEMRWRMLPTALLAHYDNMSRIGGHALIWKNMFICQPPSKEVVLEYCICFKTEDGGTIRLTQRTDISPALDLIVRDEGVRIVDVVRAFRGIINEAEEDFNQKISHFDGPLEISARGVADEFCPWIQEVSNGQSGQMDIEPGSQLVPARTSQVRTVRKLVFQGLHPRTAPFLVWN